MITAPDHREFMLAELRLAHMRARLFVMEIETIGLALRKNIIGPETAVEWLAWANCLGFLRPYQYVEDGEETQG